MVSLTVASSAPFSENKEPYELEDFMPVFDKPIEEKPTPVAAEHPERNGKTWQQMLEKAKAITRRAGGKVPN